MVGLTSRGTELDGMCLFVRSRVQAKGQRRICFLVGISLALRILSCCVLANVHKKVMLEL